ncbi:patatin-like phospholipase family protein [Marinobacter sp. MDS2]|uniref:patatin-like phospholipase family protein n=1 Tax=Marinobacter sp. MDS2 TaxID=3065961 RepID=UPI00273A9584|nr:patatin-like phospholipase family protein [Marinobacter sp. MDS2]MDP4546336.1 patatin-like phospholipase family protein [Marinobacter sp. MDS2]
MADKGNPEASGSSAPEQPVQDGVSAVVESSDVSSASATVRQTGNGKTVALTLGSGGARGYAHIGAIEVLHERGYKIIAVSGCSMGALVGGMYAAGKLQEYKDWVTGLGQFDVLKLLDVTFTSIGAIRGEKVFSVVREILGDTRIEELPMSYTAVATDLLAHKEIWFQEGPLDQAIRASIAIPSVVTPLVLNGRVLVDGALLNPLPIIPTISAHADLVMAVNLSGEDDQHRRIPDAAFSSDNDEGRDIEEWVGAVRDKASRWFDWDTLKSLTTRGPSSDESPEDKISREIAKKTAEDNKKSELKAKLEERSQNKAKQKEEHPTIDWDKLGIGKFDVMNLTIETMQSALVQYKIAGYPPDLLVNIPKNASRSYDYHKAPELIRLGRERMTAALDRFEESRSSSGPLAL